MDALKDFRMTMQHSPEDLAEVARESLFKLNMLEFFTSADHELCLITAFFMVDAGLVLARDEPYPPDRAIRSAEHLFERGPKLWQPRSLKSTAALAHGFIEDLTQGRDGLWKNKLGVVLAAYYASILEKNLSEPVIDTLVTLWNADPMTPVPPEDRAAPQGDAASSSPLKAFAADLQAILDDQGAGSHEVKKRVQDVVRRMHESTAK